MAAEGKTRRIYLDNAATSWPKPEAVYRAVEHVLRELGAPAGRSAYAEAVEVERLVSSARRRAAELLGAANPRHIIFAANGTDALNLALWGLARPGDHFVTSVVEHNSVLRPLAEMEARLGVSVTRVDCDDRGVVDPADVRAAMRPNTRAVAIVHAANVTGAIQPVAEIGRLAHEAGALVVVDAAQTAGDLPLDVDRLGADLLAAPGHKGLLGPLGTGILYIRPGVESHLQTLRQGGTGTKSQSDRQPEELPERFECGNLNVPGIVGLGAGIDYLLTHGVSEVRRHTEFLAGLLLSDLAEIPGVRVFGPADAADRVGLVSFTVPGYDPQEVAALLDAQSRIAVRAGLHCAPLCHRRLGTIDRGGTVRASFGPFNTSDDVEALAAAVVGLAEAGV